MWTLLFAALTLSTPTHAGCAVDEDREARQASAALVVLGEVVSIEVSEEEGELVVWERVRVTEALKGEVRQGGLLLRTGLPSRGCPPVSVFPVGTEVYVIGEPDARGSVPVSACTDDVGLAAARSDLQRLARQQRGAAQVVEGVSPEPPTPRLAPQGEPGPEQLYVQLGQRRHQGALIARREGAVEAEFDLGGYSLRRAVPPQRLVPVVREDHSVEGGLVVAGGARVDAEGRPQLGEGLRLLAPLPEAAISDHFLPSETSWYRPPEGAALLLPSGALELYGAPGGPPRVSVAADLDVAFTLWALGEPEDGWVRARVDSRWLRGEAWVREADVTLDADAGGVVGGVIGGVLGGSQPTRVRLPPGTELRQPGTGDLLGEVGDVGLMALWLADGPDGRLVVLETPWGPEVAEASLPVEEPGRCE
ncbi:MAG: hypothetical protein H6741_30795 [Alphaproteobacteria bacterium]|nr:hypothetical protein [Alphaproteobacteria bacterium]